MAVITKPDVPLGDRINMAFMNTSVTRGRGEMIVTSTGMNTEMGHIADLLNKTDADKTPLQKQLDRLTIIIASLAGLAFVLMIILGLRNGQTLRCHFHFRHRSGGGSNPNRASSSCNNDVLDGSARTC